MHIISGLNREVKKDSMTPFDKWYTDCSNIKEKMDNYVKKILIKERESNLIDAQMMEDAELLYNTGTTMEKTLVITAVAAIESIFLNPSM